MTTASTSLSERATLWRELAQGEKTWDLVIVGGGIIGAGVLREAARRGLSALLVEQRDFAWGTSSRSSKMVHGGLRYIASGDIRLTRDAVRERERLLHEAPGLIERMGYYFTLRRGQFPGRYVFSLLLAFYDWLAGIRNHRYVSRDEMRQNYDGIDQRGLKGAVYYTDTVTDDARLVLRVLQEAVEAGGRALNYAKADSLIREDGRVCGVVLHNAQGGERAEVRARAVISATGAWADRLRNEVNPEKRIRPLRGSHLVLPFARLPVPDALTLLHPADRRPVFVFPWEGTTVVGTTDLDHGGGLDEEPAISDEEVDYLLTVLQQQFPDHAIGRGDIVSTWSGVRPVIGSEKSRDPSKERRDHAVWNDQGLVTVSGGKLTTFRLIALDAINAACGEPAAKVADERVFSAVTLAPAELDTTDESWARRLLGRYGDRARELFDIAGPGETRPIAGTLFCLAECRWAARHEAVVHLDDLLLRRTRLGCIVARGAEDLLPELETICREELGWDSERWRSEVARYLALWRRHYYLPSQDA
ncbi:MAG: FAD-dependent oxidoreductase [Halioglobus sp.]|nr:FAD-dependent oxidoreductase [Halioglobus sp.]